MDPAKHTRRDNLTIAALCGITSRHVVEIAYERGTITEAVAELHAESTDPHLLAHAIAGGHWSDKASRAVLVLAAGADRQTLAEVTRWLNNLRGWQRN